MIDFPASVMQVLFRTIHVRSISFSKLKQRNFPNDSRGKTTARYSRIPDATGALAVFPGLQFIIDQLVLKELYR